MSVPRKPPLPQGGGSYLRAEDGGLSPAASATRPGKAAASPEGAHPKRRGRKPGPKPAPASPEPLTPEPKEP